MMAASFHRKSHQESGECTCARPCQGRLRWWHSKWGNLYCCGAHAFIGELALHGWSTRYNHNRPILDNKGSTDEQMLSLYFTFHPSIYHLYVCSFVLTVWFYYAIPLFRCEVSLWTVHVCLSLCLHFCQWTRLEKSTFFCFHFLWK